MATGDFKLDKVTHDLVIDESTNWDLEILTGMDYYEQKIKIKFLFFKGEWFLDTTVGVDWYGTVLVKNPNLTNVDNLLKITALEEPFMISLIEWISSYDINNNTYTVNFKADTDAGELTFNEDLPV
jgi:hypothetical protein